MITTITDTITGRVVTCESTDIAETLAPLFPDAPADVQEAIAALEVAVRRGEDTTGLEAFLAVEVGTS